eukprot:TRINITY_DN76314_c0_g1_i2.p1 TRINITY_DN76314_c0_g1~~TRINITY_DN76314_c0_g1_i2.p1  ORF type:complete len:1167 (+),score=240.29 TRINITY_DN76314_c0_g1_i2:25-3525(+)
MLRPALSVLAVLLSLQRFTLSPSITTPSATECLYATQRRQFQQAFSLSPVTPHQSRSLCLLTLLLAGDIHSNPGPRAASTYPCGFCDQHVGWSVRAVCCDECSIWYHLSCLEMCTRDYSVLQRSNVSWQCCKCDTMNIHSFTFRSFEISSNYYDPIADESLTSEVVSPTFKPMFTSSPRSVHSRPSSETSGQRSQNPSQRASSTQTSSSIYDLPKKTNLRIMSLNCQSIVQKGPDLKTSIQYIKPDVICGCESWLNAKVESSEIFPDEYQVYRKDRKTNTTGGGVFTLVHKDIVSSAEPDLDTDCEVLWVKIQLRKKKELLIGSFYMPHRQERDIQELNKSLEKATPANKPRQLILCGDFNCPDVNWENGTTTPGAPQRQVQEALVDATASAQLTQVHAEPTRGPNILSLVFTSNPTLVKHSTSVPGISDHSTVVTDMDTQVFYQRQRPRKIHLFARANWEGLDADLKQMAEEIETRYDQGADVESLWSTFRDSTTKAVDTHVPSKMSSRKKNLPWLSGKLKALLKKKKRLFAKAKKTYNWNNYKFVQKECRRQLRKAERDYVNNTIADGLSSNNSKPFWRYIHSRRQDSMGVSPLKKNGSLVSDTRAKAEILIDQFKSVFTKDDGDSGPLHDQPVQDNIQNITVVTAGVAKLLKALNPAKACGPDRIPNIVLKSCADVLAPALRCIFQQSLDTGDLPRDWRSANIACAFKKGDKHQAENYRPISLTSVASKLLEHIVCHHLHKFFDQLNVLTPLNHGFRTGYSCETQLLTTTHDLFKSFEADTQVDVAVLDFSKAFDTVPHNKLLFKLSHYGVRGLTHRWIKNFLTRRTMKVVLDGEESREVPVESGVPQGTVLGPLLFLCHINDLPATVKSNVRLFADDCLLYRQIETFSDHLTLRDDLKRLEQWATDWGMRFNPKKCCIISIKKETDYFYSLCGEFLKSVSAIPYLGVMISDDLKWQPHINNICKKANTTLGFLRRNLRHFPKPCKRTAYIALVRSTLEYASVVWDPYYQGDIDQLERIQHRAARFITGDYKSRNPGCVSEMLGKLHLPSLQERRHDKRLSLLFRVVEGSVPGLPPVSFITEQKRNKRRIIPKQFADCVASNIIIRSARQNSRPLKVPEGTTEEFKNSYFVRSVVDWNNLSDDHLQAGIQDQSRPSSDSIRGL